ncbi:hypothetical protein SAMN05660649_02968 [Desulfotomaculum arcticum]|uniref:Yip1 domain-containing protein n=1 Tax=Desulfotruncus arcticus DSM 17038 TaxID=1121424 RepID=A0A1I2VDX0_9FIRM|nr:Yip1 family protein [Desulfotruncus arcticus]SFG87544.1 hypothetical protein SAMN05660649_02968 [Desulfotomaculum arcticum] [Desulfotruncus arcticus DSM 17038]
MENQDGTYGTEREEQIKHVYPEQERDIILNNDELSQNKIANQGSEFNLNSEPESKNEPVQAGILDIIYGTLFDPARTFAGFARNPRIGAAVLIVISINLLEALMGYYTTPRFMQSLRVPGMLEHDYIKLTSMLFAMGGFVFSLGKWFFMSGLLNLLSELFGGKGNARNVFAVYGIAGLPVVFMLPVQVMLMIFPEGFLQTLAAALFGTAIFIWSTVLLVIGLREVHQFSTGKAALVVIIPGGVLIVLAIVFMVIIGATMANPPVGRFI